ncbi:hypothetical protein HDV05_004188 [Chytridiales sp. JEL 0842]|nr:hypothetical protein HDV05_004188 [Chytridiales sp. JEL 0842]
MKELPQPPLPANAKGKPNKKAKKSIGALMIASGVAATVAFPHFFNSLSTLRTKTLSSAATTATKNQYAARLANNRAQSMHVPQSTSSMLGSGSRSGAAVAATSPTVRQSTIARAAESNNSTAKPSGNVSFKQQDDEEEEDWDAELQISNPTQQPSTKDLPIVGLKPRAPQAPLRKPILPPSVVAGGGPHPPATPRKPANPSRRMLPHQRRVQSAPSAAFKKIGDEDNDVFDALFEDEDEELPVKSNSDGAKDQWFVASVKAKVQKRTEKELERSISANAGLESWDDDFFDEDDNGVGKAKPQVVGGGMVGGLKIPEAVGSVQESIKMDAINVRRFAWHIEDLRLLYLDALDIAQGLQATNPNPLVSLQKKYVSWLDHTQVLIDLGDFSEEKADRMVSDDKHLQIFADILGLPQDSDEEDSAFIVEGGKEVLTRKTLKEVVGRGKGKMEFGLEYVPTLIEHAGVVKRELGEYVRELRRLAIAS